MGELIRKRWFQVIGVIVLLTTFVVVYRYFGPKDKYTPTNIVADICGVKVSRLEYQAAIRRRTARIYYREKMLRGSDQEIIHLSVFKQLANDKLLEKMGQEKGIGVTEKELQDRIARLKRSISPDSPEHAFRLALEMMGYSTDDDYRELKNDLRYEVLEYKLSERMHPHEQYSVSDQDIKDQIPTMQLQQIFFIFDPNKRANEDINEASVQIRERAQDVYRRAMAGEDFGKLAQEFSQERYTSLSGNIGWISRGMVTKDYWDRVARLKPGEISKPFETQYGLHIVKCLQRRKPGDKEYEDYKNVVKSAIIFKQQKHAFAADFAKMVTRLQEKGCIDLYDHMLLANRYRTMGKYDMAIKEYREALKEEPDNPYYYVDIGEIYGMQGEPDEALTHLRKATEIAPRDPSLFFRLGEVYMGYGEHEKSLREFKKASDMAKLDHELHLRLQSIYTQLGLLQEADEEHRRHEHALELLSGVGSEDTPDLPVRDEEDPVMFDFGLGQPGQGRQLRQPGVR